MATTNHTSDPAAGATDLPIPEGYRSEQWVAERLGLKVATLRIWAARKSGPPRVSVGRRPIYREAAFYAWLERQERDFEAGRRQPVRRGPKAA